MRGVVTVVNEEAWEEEEVEYASLSMKDHTKTAALSDMLVKMLEVEDKVDKILDAGEGLLLIIFVRYFKLT